MSHPGSVIHTFKNFSVGDQAHGKTVASGGPGVRRLFISYQHRCGDADILNTVVTACRSKSYRLCHPAARPPARFFRVIFKSLRRHPGIGATPTSIGKDRPL